MQAAPTPCQAAPIRERARSLTPGRKQGYPIPSTQNEPQRLDRDQPVNPAAALLQPTNLEYDHVGSSRSDLPNRMNGRGGIPLFSSQTLTSGNSTANILPFQHVSVCRGPCDLRKLCSHAVVSNGMCCQRSTPVRPQLPSVGENCTRRQ